MPTSLETQDSSPTVNGDMAQQFIEQGFLNPIEVLSTQACQQFLREADNPAHPPPIDWYKGYSGQFTCLLSLWHEP